MKLPFSMTYVTLMLSRPVKQREGNLPRHQCHYYFPQLYQATFVAKNEVCIWIFKDRVRCTKEGNVFLGVCLPTGEEGGRPSSLFLVFTEMI